MCLEPRNSGIGTRVRVCGGVRGRRQGAGRRSRRSWERGGVHTYASLESTFGVLVLILCFCVYSKKKIQQRTDGSAKERFRAKSSSDSMFRCIFFPLSYCNVVRRTVKELWTALPRRGSSMAWMPRLGRPELGMWWLAWQGALAVKGPKAQGSHPPGSLRILPAKSQLCISGYQPIIHRLLQAKTSGRADSQHSGMRDQVTDALELSLSQNSASQIVHSCYSAHVCKLQSDITSLSRHSFPRNAKAPKPLSRPARSERESQKKAQS